jgi:hypothetical protein
MMPNAIYASKALWCRMLSMQVKLYDAECYLCNSACLLFAFLKSLNSLDAVNGLVAQHKGSFEGMV